MRHLAFLISCSSPSTIARRAALRSSGALEASAGPVRKMLLHLLADWHGAHGRSVVFHYLAAVLLTLGGLWYPLAAIPSKADYFRGEPSLDGLRYLQLYNPADRAAIEWLRANIAPDALVLEASGGSYSPEGDSPYGCADMAGNAWEWVADWFGHDYYGVSPRDNPAGPGPGPVDWRVLRGGSWDADAWQVRAACRWPYRGDLAGLDTGFRCAVAAP